MADTRYLSFAFIGQEGWAYTDTLCYVVPPLDETEECGVSLLLHTEGYGYENIALDIVVSQDSAQLCHHQYNYSLSENSTDEGIGHRCDYTLPVGNFTLCDTLPTSITLVHRMDHPILIGIREVGIRFKESVNKLDTVVWRVNWQ